MLQNIHFDLENMCARTWDWTNYTQEQTQFAFKLHIHWNRMTNVQCGLINTTQRKQRDPRKCANSEAGKILKLARQTKILTL